MSLVAEKANYYFDWDNLWAVLCKFRFGPYFIIWLHILYSSRTARVPTNNSAPSLSIEE